MNARRPLPILSLLALTLMPATAAFAQCTNQTQYPSNAIIPDPGGALTTISSCSFTVEYSRVTSIVAGATYQFTINSGYYITVHQGTFDGPVLGHGFSPVTVTAATSEDLFATWTIDAACTGETTCQVTTVQLFLNCTPPVASYSVADDCANQVFNITVNVGNTGDGSSVNINYTVNQDPPQAIFSVGAGSYLLGPFPLGAIVDVVVAHESDPACNLNFPDLQSLNTCPYDLTCGGPNVFGAYCYDNNDNEHWAYHSTGGESLALLFSQGTIESDTWDHLDIYDGPDNTYPQIFTHDGVFNTQDLTGVLAVSTGPDLYMEMSSDGSVSCSSGSMTEWQWTVGCLDCTQPDASYQVSLDCANNQFYINTTLTAVGSDPTVEITNTGGAPDITVTEPGTYSSGPFAFGSSVRVEVVNDVNFLCSVKSPWITNPPCPNVSCGPDQYTYCYPNTADTAMVYQSANTYPIAMIFNSGQMSTFGDSIYVYDGPDYQSNLVFSGANNGDLSGLLFTSTNPANALLLRIRSNFYSSCVDNLYTPMDWNVSCLDCTNPVATFELVPDCVHNGFNIAANVTSTGTSPTLRIVNSWNGDTLSNVGVGTTLIGPIPVDSVAHLTVLNSQNPLCRIVSPEFTYASDSCINLACLPTGQEYCYTNADTAYFTYTSGNTNAITLSFGYGQLLVNDFIQIFNGLDTTAQMVYMGNQGGQIGGLAITSNNADNALTMLVISSQAGSCATGQGFPPLYWTVGCGLVGVSEVEEGDFQLFPNPTNGELFIRLPDAERGAVRMEVMDVTGRLVRSEQFNAASGSNAQFDMSELQSGNYTVVLSTDSWRRSRALQLVR